MKAISKGSLADCLVHSFGYQQHWPFGPTEPSNSWACSL